MILGAETFDFQPTNRINIFIFFDKNKQTLKKNMMKECNI